MRKILLIDKDTYFYNVFKKSLSGSNDTLIKEGSLRKAVKHLKNKVDLIAFNSSLVKEIRASAGFKKYTSETPRIILINRNESKNNSLWLSGRAAFPLFEPASAVDVRKLLKRLLDIKAEEEDSRNTKAELKDSGEELDFLGMLAETYTADHDPVNSLTSIMERTRILTEARTWSLLINDRPVFKKIHFGKSRNIHKCDINKDKGIAGYVFEKGKPSVAENASKDKRFDKNVDHHLNLQIKSLACVQVKIESRPIGVLRLINKSRGNHFTQYDLKLLEHSARYIGMVLERALLHQKIEKLRITDELTNVFNIRYLHQTIDMEVERTRRYGSIFSVIFMDIDNFKKVNDRFGHLVGSKILIEVALLLKKNMRKLDIITRYGGDEYVIIMPQTTRQACMLVAERLRRDIEEEVFLKSEGRSIRITASFGVASYPDNARSKEDLLKIADKAMYHGKFLTKNIVFEAKQPF